MRTAAKGVKCVEFCGFQKLTLLDYPGRIAATLFTGGCNLRCPFCHNGGLVLSPEGLYSEEEVLTFLHLPLFCALEGYVLWQFRPDSIIYCILLGVAYAWLVNRFSKD